MKGNDIMNISELKVLICDDSILVRKKLGDVLKAAGITQIYEAKDGVQAVEMYKEKNPRGEYVLVLEGGIKEDKADEFPADPEEHVKMYESQGMKRMDAIKAAAKDRGVSKGVLYKELLGE